MSHESNVPSSTPRLVPSFFHTYLQGVVESFPTLIDPLTLHRVDIRWPSETYYLKVTELYLGVASSSNLHFVHILDEAGYRLPYRHSNLIFQSGYVMVYTGGATRIGIKADTSTIWPPVRGVIYKLELM